MSKKLEFTHFWSCEKSGFVLPVTLLLKNFLKSQPNSLNTEQYTQFLETSQLS